MLLHCKTSHKASARARERASFNTLDTHTRTHLNSNVVYPFRCALSIHWCRPWLCVCACKCEWCGHSRIDEATICWICKSVFVFVILAKQMRSMCLHFNTRAAKRTVFRQSDVHKLFIVIQKKLDDKDSEKWVCTHVRLSEEKKRERKKIAEQRQQRQRQRQQKNTIVKQQAKRQQQQPFYWHFQMNTERKSEKNW